MVESGSRPRRRSLDGCPLRDRGPGTRDRSCWAGPSARPSPAPTAPMRRAITIPGPAPRRFMCIPTSIAICTGFPRARASSGKLPSLAFLDGQQVLGHTERSGAEKAFLAAGVSLPFQKGSCRSSPTSCRSFRGIPNHPNVGITLGWSCRPSVPATGLDLRFGSRTRGACRVRRPPHPASSAPP